MKTRKKLKTVALFILLSIYCWSAVACDTIISYLQNGEQSPLSASEDVEEVESYTIMYNDGKNHTITVEYGGLWEMEKPLPTKEGYVFDGLYTAAEGGEKYASKYGMCISPFYDQQNIVLYPQFLPKQYKLLLNYGEAIQNGSPFLIVSGGKEIPILPFELSIPDQEYMKFTGWYTEAAPTRT